MACSSSSISCCCVVVVVVAVVVIEYKVDSSDLRLSGLESFTFDYIVKWPISLVVSRKVSTTTSSAQSE